MGVPATNGQEKSNLADMQIGDYIACEYTASSYVCGNFANLGNAIKNEIPIGASATPDGKFYFIKADTGLLIADRVVQHGISWDTLNKSGFIEGKVIISSTIPKMIDYTSTEIVVSADSEYTSDASPCLAWKAFNKTNDDYLDCWMSSNGISYPHWLKVEFNNPKIINSYHITTRNHSSYPSVPCNWEFQGSNDDLKWEILHYVTNGFEKKDNNEKIFSFVNEKSYKYYRIYITMGSRTSNVAIANMELLDSASSIFLIRSLSGGIAYVLDDDTITTTRPNVNNGTFPTNNEWDKYIVNSDLNGSITAGDANVWHWNDFIYGSITKDTVLTNPSNRVARGGYNSFNDIKFMTQLAVGTIYGSLGFRPVLEYLEPDSKATTLWY